MLSESLLENGWKCCRGSRCPGVRCVFSRVPEHPVGGNSVIDGGQSVDGCMPLQCLRLLREYRWLQNRDWLPTDAVFSFRFRNCKGTCSGFEMRSNKKCEHREVAAIRKLVSRTPARIATQPRRKHLRTALSRLASDFPAILLVPPDFRAASSVRTEFPHRDHLQSESVRRVLAESFD
jgi:hypothetical protein